MQVIKVVLVTTALTEGLTGRITPCTKPKRVRGRERPNYDNRPRNLFSQVKIDTKKRVDDIVTSNDDVVYSLLVVQANSVSGHLF